MGGNAAGSALDIGWLLDAIAAVNAVSEASKSAAPVDEAEDDAEDDDNVDGIGASAPDEKADRSEAGVALYGSDGIGAEVRADEEDGAEA